MKKNKLILATILLGIMLSCVACAPKDCKEEDCDKEIFKEGFCEYHYYENSVTEGLEDLFQ